MQNSEIVRLSTSISLKEKDQQPDGWSRAYKPSKIRPREKIKMTSYRSMVDLLIEIEVLAMAHNFKTTAFSGNLKELFELCWKEMPDIQSHLDAHQWLLDQSVISGNILTIRKFSPHDKRGVINSLGNLYFLPVDNEPLCALYKKWKNNIPIRHDLIVLLKNHDIPASWFCDIPNKHGMKYFGVSTSFRDNGLKLAHINDAAKGISPLINLPTITLRFLRSLSPLNIFLFPSHKKVSFKLISSTQSWVPHKKDWAEDDWVRSVALGWLIDKIGNNNSSLFNAAQISFGANIIAHPNWNGAATGTIVSITPKGLASIPSQTLPKTPANINNNQVAPLACQKISKANAVNVIDAVEILRDWRAAKPTATQLDGLSKNNPSPWLYINVDGYTSPLDDFLARGGKQFLGADYNAVVNFHGDTKALKIDEFIDLIDASIDYKDVLRPSATYEQNTAPVGRLIKPKFALVGYSSLPIDGFNLYHD